MEGEHAGASVSQCGSNLALAQEGAPKVKKPVAAELGCVTPYIVVPGNWTAKDMDYYAEEIVAGLVHNAGHNCLKGEILVTDAEWPQRAQFVEAVRCALHMLQGSKLSGCSTPLHI